MAATGNRKTSIGSVSQHIRKLHTNAESKARCSGDTVELDAMEIHCTIEMSRGLLQLPISHPIRHGAPLRNEAIQKHGSDRKAVTGHFSFFSRKVQYLFPLKTTTVVELKKCRLMWCAKFRVLL